MNESISHSLFRKEVIVITMENNLLNAQEVAEILKIARNTVYELIKRGDLTSSKVGKQVRVDRQEVDAYLERSKNDSQKRNLGQTNPKPSINQVIPANTDEILNGKELIICGQDISLDILVNHLNSFAETVQVYRSYMGSYNSIYSLYQGRVNVATAHLWDGDTNEYNISFVRKMMPGIPVLMIRIGKRRQGFYVPKGNPKNFTGWTDLKRSDITLANREKGSGTRILLDEKLRLMGIFGEYIEGYSLEYKSHLAVATAVARGTADVAIGSEYGCKSMDSIEFIPLQTECYDLIIKLSDAEKQPYRTMLEIIASDAFKMDLDSLDSYDTAETGKIIWR